MPVRRGRILATSLRLPGSGNRLPALLLEAAVSSPPTPLIRLGRARALLLTEPRDVSHVLVGASGAGYDKPRRMTGPGMRWAAGEGVLTSPAAEAAARRALVAPALRGDAITSHAELAGRLTARRIGSWLDRGEFDLFEDLARLVREVAIATTLGEEWRAISPQLEAALHGRRARMTGALIARLDPRARRNADGALEAELARVLAGARAAGGARGSIMDRLLARSDDDRAVLEELRTLLLSAYDTVAAAAAWTLLELAQSPEQLGTVRAEAGRDGPPPEAGGHPAMTAAIEEALRLHPPVLRFHRKALRGDRLPSGARVPRGRIVLISPFVLGRLPRLWGEPSRYDLTRFDPRLARHDKYAHIPFGSGPRVCIARQLALRQLRAIVGEIVTGLDLGPLASAAPDAGSAQRRPSCHVQAVMAG